MSLCLGPCEVSVAEMVSAYTTFANGGIRVAPLFVSRIEDNDGNVVATFQPRMTEVISAESANKMLQAIRDCNIEKKNRFPVRGFILPVESSTYMDGEALPY